MSDLVQYLHRACFSPVVKTWTHAIDAGFFTTWPGLTSALVRKHLPKSLAMAKGHLRQDRKKCSLHPTTIHHTTRQHTTDYDDVPSRSREARPNPVCVCQDDVPSWESLQRSNWSFPTNLESRQQICNDLLRSRLIGHPRRTTEIPQRIRTYTRLQQTP